MSGVVMFEPDFDQHRGPVRDRAGLNQLVSDDEHHRPQNETSVAVDPNNPNHILGGCNDYRGGDASAGYFVTFDGGQTWQDELIPGLDDFDAAGNPSVAIGRNGRAWFCGIHFNRDNDRGGIFISRSEDGGLNWGELTYLIVHPDEQNPPFEDKPYIAVDNTEGEFDGRLYVSWTRFGTGQIYFSRSENDGDDWTEPMRLYENNGQGSLPVVASDGGLYVIWKDYTEDRIIGRYSNDGGESFRDIFVVTETDGLSYYLAPTELRVNSIPSVAIDISNEEHRDRIYVAWADERNGDTDILMVWSDDGAENWTEPIRLNDDEFQNGIDQFFPWLAVDPVSGVLFTAWYDRRLDENNLLIDLFGIHWNGNGDLPENERISSENIDPRIGGFNGRFMGDNIGIAALAGRAHPAWCDTRNDNQDIYWAPFEGEQHFIVINGDREHRFAIENLTINDEPAQVGDELAVIDANGWVVGIFVIEDENSFEMTATGNWTNPRGFGYLQWAVWDDSEQVELAGAPWILEGDELLTDGGFTSLTITAPPPDTQDAVMDHNCNLVSVGLYPVNLDIEQLFNPIRAGVRKISDRDGNFFVPEMDFSNMLPFDPLQGYLVGITEEQLTWSVSGVRINPQTPIPLREGWSITAYLPDYALDPWIGFDSIIDDLIIGKNDMGEFMVPDRGFCGIRSLEPSEGYQLKLERESELVYPEQDRDFIAVDRRFPETEPRHFPKPRITNGNMSVLIQDVIFRSAVQADFDVIAAVSKSGTVVGLVKTDTPPPWGMAVWVDDPMTQEMDGLTDGDELRLRAWSSIQNREYSMIVSVIEGDNEFTVDGFSVIRLSATENYKPTPEEFGIDRIYHNPFNASAQVSFRLSRICDASMSLYDLDGRLMQETYLRDMSPGIHQVQLSSFDLPSGMYILVLRSSELTDRKKAMVIR